MAMNEPEQERTTPLVASAYEISEEPSFSADEPPADLALEAAQKAWEAKYGPVPEPVVSERPQVQSIEPGITENDTPIALRAESEPDEDTTYREGLPEDSILRTRAVLENPGRELRERAQGFEGVELAPLRFPFDRLG